MILLPMPSYKMVSLSISRTAPKKFCNEMGLPSKTISNIHVLYEEPIFLELFWKGIQSYNRTNMVHKCSAELVLVGALN